MNTFKCPGCGGDIQIENVSQGLDDIFDLSHYRITLETRIKHVAPITEPACADFFVALGKEQADILNKLVARIAEGPSQDLHGS